MELKNYICPPCQWPHGKPNLSKLTPAPVAGNTTDVPQGPAAADASSVLGLEDDEVPAAAANLAALDPRANRLAAPGTRGAEPDGAGDASRSDTGPNYPYEATNRPAPVPQVGWPFISRCQVTTIP